MLRRNRRLREKLIRYLETGKQTVNCFRDGVRHYCEHGLEGLDAFARTTHHGESQCDRIRRLIEVELFEKSLMPESREDIMMLLEQLDLVINQSEEIIRQIVLERIVLPNDYLEDFGELGATCHRASQLVMDQALSGFEGETDIQTLGDRIDHLESEADQTEQAMVGRLFTSNLELAEKMLYRDLVRATARLGDLAEDAANMITVCRVKREI